MENLFYSNVLKWCVLGEGRRWNNIAPKDESGQLALV